MVVKKYIVYSLKRLDQEYNIALASSEPTMAVYLSKLAVIEYCGWIEETMDAIIGSYAQGKLKTSAFRESLNKKIESTHGFQYKKHFRPMLVHVLGIIRCEKIQKSLDQNGDLATLKSELDTFTEHRNRAAHTHVNRVLTTYPSPSVTLGSFNTVYPILKRVYTMRKNAKFV